MSQLYIHSIGTGMIYVVKATYVEQYKISLTFSDGKEGIVDLKKVIFDDPRPIFQALQDINNFQKFTVEMDTIVWENGLDLSPEFLYQNTLCPLF